MSSALAISDSYDPRLRRERPTGVKQSRSFSEQIEGVLIALAILASIVAAFVFYPRASSVVGAQVRRQQRRTRPQTQTEAEGRSKTAPGGASFKHEDHRLPKA